MKIRLIRQNVKEAARGEGWQTYAFMGNAYAMNRELGIDIHLGTVGDIYLTPGALSKVKRRIAKAENNARRKTWI